MELKHIYLKVQSDSKDIVENYRTKYSGKMDTENVYKNYYYSETQKSRNLVRISVDIILPNQILTCINWKYKWYLLIKWVV
jgi:hypothetical protein